tara:strand:- start:1 stop:303 length:303 start_codon:yes stop_codon:yes gene_type:complete
MNEHILLVMKWLDDPGSVSKEERDRNKEDARSYYATVSLAYRYSNKERADDAVAAAVDAYYASYFASADNHMDRATHWVEEYFKQTGEDKQLYLGKIKEG